MVGCYSVVTQQGYPYFLTLGRVLQMIGNKFEAKFMKNVPTMGPGFL